MNAFHIVGILLAVWAVVLAGLGIRRPSFPESAGGERAVRAISIVLIAGAIGAAIVTSALEDEDEPHAEEGAAPSLRGAGEKLELSADPAGDLKFDKDALEAKPGRITLVMANPAPLAHNVAVEGEGLDEKGKVVEKGGTSSVTVDLKPGEYVFYCSVPGHRGSGMEGTLTVE